jgi:MOSC domain-containing protein YiiM
MNPAVSVPAPIAALRCAASKATPTRARAFVRHRYLARRQSRLPDLRQAHLIPSELFAALHEAGFEVALGDLGENITTAGAEPRVHAACPHRARATAVIELTGLWTPCVLIDRFRAA